MKEIAIYGAGGFGREVVCLINSINGDAPTWNFLGFFDDNLEIGFNNEYGNILGGIDTLNSWKKEINIVIAVGKPSVLKQIYESISNPLVSFPNLFAPDICWYDRDQVFFGHGNIISRRCQFSCNIHIGNFNIFNYDIGIGHDTSIGNFNSFMTSAKLAGNVKIGNLNYFGVNSVVLQGLTIGNDVLVAAGSVIMRRTKDGYTYIGTPANAWVMTKKNNK